MGMYQDFANRSTDMVLLYSEALYKYGMVLTI